MASSGKKRRTAILSEAKVRELLGTSGDSDNEWLTDSDIDCSDSEAENDESAVMVGVLKLVEMKMYI